MILACAQLAGIFWEPTPEAVVCPPRQRLPGCNERIAKSIEQLGEESRADVQCRGTIFIDDQKGKPMQQLTIELPEALAQRLAWLAAAQQKSVEQIALERLALLLEAATPPPGSPAAILQAMREPPHVSWEDVNELEQAIAEGQLPVQEEGVFDE